MPGPFDYTSAFADVQSPQDAMMSGLKNGVGIAQLQAERTQAQAAAAQQAQMRADLTELSKNPTTQGIIATSIKYPQLSESIKRSYDMLEPNEQRTRLEMGLPVFTALHNNQPEIAAKLLKDQALALRNAGKVDDAKAAEAKVQLIADNPAAAKIALGGTLSALIGPEKFAKMMGDVGDEARKAELQPMAVKEATGKADGAVADATTKGVQAKYAERDALQEFEKKGWDIKKIRAGIANDAQNTRIAAMSAAAAREGNSLKRQELMLKIDDAKRERDDKLRGKLADVESATSSMDNMLNTIARIEKNPRLDAVLGSIEGRTPAITDDGSDAIALIETLGSQAFLAQIPNIKGMGALSNAEGEKLQSAFQNLSRVQSEKQFRTTLKEATRLLNKGREAVGKRYGVPVGAPDTPAADKPKAGGVVDFGSLK